MRKVRYAQPNLETPNQYGDLNTQDVEPGTNPKVCRVFNRRHGFIEKDKILQLAFLWAWMKKRAIELMIRESVIFWSLRSLSSHIMMDIFMTPSSSQLALIFPFSPIDGKYQSAPNSCKTTSVANIDIP